MTVRVGLISDTHGLLRPEALEFLRGSDLIVHGGDIGNAGILQRLSQIAPVHAVRGNNDRGAWAESIAESLTIRVGDVVIHAIHDRAALAIDPLRDGIRVVVSGHSHKPSADDRDGVLHINPGSAGPRRFRLPVTAAELVVDGGKVAVRIADLLGGDAAN